MEEIPREKNVEFFCIVIFIELRQNWERDEIIAMRLVKGPHALGMSPVSTEEIIHSLFT